MGRKSRKKKARLRITPNGKTQQQRVPRNGLSKRRWSAIALFALTTIVVVYLALSGTLASIGASTSVNELTTEALPASYDRTNSDENRRSLKTTELGPETDVLAYVGGKNESWQYKKTNELSRGQEFLLDGKLCYFGALGALRMNPDVDPRKLHDADRSFDANNWRDPRPDDVVRFLGSDGSHLRHDSLKNLKAGDQFAFQGRMYKSSQDPFDPLGVNVFDTGNVLVPVTDKFERVVDTLIDLTVTDSSGDEYIISGTPEHPFFVPATSNYVPMADLQEGDGLLAIDGATATVSASRVRHGEFSVHNIEVEGSHNYFISTPGGGPIVLVHNTCGDEDFVRIHRPGQQAANKGDRIFRMSDHELGFVGSVLERKPNLQIYRTHQKSQMGDFVIIDRTNFREPVGWIVELKTASKSPHAGIQLARASEVAAHFSLRGGSKEVTGNTSEIMELLTRGRRRFHEPWSNRDPQGSPESSFGMAKDRKNSSDVD